MEADQLLLSLAANHAAAAFQSVRLNEHHAQMWFLESLDRIDRAIQGTSDLDLMMGDVLDVVLATFRCDRAWLIYPCDPDVFQPGDPEVLSGTRGTHPAGVRRCPRRWRGHPERPGGRASVVRVAVEVHHGVLELSISDDGAGGADPARGSGLIGLTDSVDALGGTIDVASPAGQGTTLLIRLPVEAS